MSSLDGERLSFLAKLPMLLNSSLDSREVIQRALEKLKVELSAEAATVFLLADSSEELTFWALEGGADSELEGKRIPAGKGIVGWVIDRQQAIHVPDVSKDSRFLGGFSEDGDFKTREILCVPLTARGQHKIGALQLLNKLPDSGFTAEDLMFLEQFAHQLALAIYNAQLFELAQTRNHQLATINRRKDEMISVITHEFRTPLNIIGTSVELLTLNPEDEALMAELGGTLASAVRRLTRLIGEIKNAALISDEGLEISCSKVEVGELLDLLREEFISVADQRDLSLQILDSAVQSIVADQTLLLIALRNLISNAIRFTPDGGEISVGIEEEEHGLAEISVEDTGIGIAAEQQHLIFEKFYEVGNAMHHKSGHFEFNSGGLGLGLATVRSILEAHRSAIQIESTLGEGSKFFFLLPTEESGD